MTGMKGSNRKWGLFRYLVVPAFLLLFFSFTLSPSPFELPNPQDNGFHANPTVSFVGEASESPVQALIGAIRSATTFSNVSFNDADAKIWRSHNSCAARTELGPRYARKPHTKPLDPNPQWDLVLEEYAALHRTCMRSIGDITEFFRTGTATSSCKFLIMELGGVGLGNKVSLLTSAVLYAVLTQRVILINTWSLISSTMCEPFLGSSWLLDQRFPLPGRHGPESTFLGRLTGLEDPVWKSSRYFEKGVDATKRGKYVPTPSAMKVEFSDPEVTRFYCDTEQAFLAEATWLHFTGCLYFLPKLFAVPAFRPALEALFPDPSLTFTYLLRSLMLPRDNVWQQVKEHDIALFANVDTRVGIQVRFLYGRKVYFERASKRANKHVKQCISENNILPGAVREDERGIGSRTARSGQVIRVFVTSLHTALSEELLRMYDKQETTTGETVMVTQLTHRGKQGFGSDDDVMAMIEILLLSFVDKLLITPLSTFGGLAQAYGAIIPWFVEMKKNSVSCTRAQTPDLCYQMAYAYYDCPHERNIHRGKIQKTVPYIRQCLSVEESAGLQLVPSNLSSKWTSDL